MEAETEIKNIVYPNPAKNSLFIEHDNPQSKPYKLTIYDNLGRHVSQLNDLSGSQVEVNVGDYTPGLYFFKLMNAEGLKGSWGKFLVE